MKVSIDSPMDCFHVDGDDVGRKSFSKSAKRFTGAWTEQEKREKLGIKRRTFNIAEPSGGFSDDQRKLVREFIKFCNSRQIDPNLKSSVDEYLAILPMHTDQDEATLSQSITEE